MVVCLATEAAPRTPQNGQLTELGMSACIAENLHCSIEISLLVPNTMIYWCIFRDFVMTMIFCVVIHQVRHTKFGTLSRAENFSTCRATDEAVCAPLRLRAMATIDPPNSSSLYVRWAAALPLSSCSHNS